MKINDIIKKCVGVAAIVICAASLTSCAELLSTQSSGKKKTTTTQTTTKTTTQATSSTSTSTSTSTTTTVGQAKSDGSTSKGRKTVTK